MLVVLFLEVHYLNFLMEVVTCLKEVVVSFLEVAFLVVEVLSLVEHFLVLALEVDQQVFPFQLLEHQLLFQDHLIQLVLIILMV